MLAAASAYQGTVMYAAMKAGEEIGAVARQPNRNVEIGAVAKPHSTENRELR
jgi:hypothetical protein